MKVSSLKERLIESLIYGSGFLSAITVLLIIFFLFREGSGLFDRKPLEEGYAIALHPNSQVASLKAEDIRKIIEKDITNWSELGGKPLPIKVFTFNEAEEFLNLEELGDDLEKLPEAVGFIVESTPGVFAVFPKDYFPASIKTFELENIRLGDFLGGKDWYPTADPSPQLGVLPIILGTLWVSLGAMAFALPIGIAVSVYLAEIAEKQVRDVLKPIIELLAGIPSIVYGFFGLVVIVPMLQQTFDLPVGETALAGSLLLAMIALPTIISLADDAIRSTPRELKEASLALGATHWQTIIKVILPYSASGLAAACILGVGRAVGETMAVLMVTGNSAVMPESFLKPVRTITATIAAELGEAPQGGIHYEALFMLGTILFAFTFLVNVVSDFIAHKTAIK